MEPVPPHPDIADAPDLFDGGHLWIQECVDGHPFRFQVRGDARLQFGNARREFAGDDAPRAYRHAVHHVQRALDRGALGTAVADTEMVTFVGVATHRNRLAYDWGRLPSVLVTDVHDASQSDADASRGDADAGRFLPPARVEQVVERLGLMPVNAVAKEVRGADFDPAAYEFPESAWRDGPVAGVLVRTKTGRRAVLNNDAVLDDADAGAGDYGSAGGDAVANVDTVLAEYAPASRFQRVARDLDASGRPVTFDAVRERVLDSIYREHAPVFCEGRPPVDVDAFEAAVAERTNAFLADR